jgi:hypothetical protein
MLAAASRRLIIVPAPCGVQLIKGIVAAALAAAPPRRPTAPLPVPIDIRHAHR